MVPARPLVICLMGPTASGKTDLAMALCERLPCEVVSVDSAMIYRQMDVGTAKPSPAELATVPHRLIDILDPAESYSAARFRLDALAEMAEIVAGGRIPLLVGGTMLYFKALIEGIAELPPGDPAVRERLIAEAGEKGWQHLYQRLETLDPDAAGGIHPNNHQRLLRALEVLSLTRKPISRHWRTGPKWSGNARDYTYWQGDGGATLPYTVVQIALMPEDRGELHRKIDRRFAGMLEQGLVEEVRALRARGDLDLDLPSMRCVGYRQVWEHLDGRYGAAEMIARSTAATRQLAKRQLTWLRSWRGLHLIGSAAADKVETALKIIEGGST